MIILAGLGVFLLAGCGLLDIRPEPKVYKGSEEYAALCHFTWYPARETKREAIEARVTDEMWMRCRPNVTMDIVVEVGE